ncbi:putative GIY-YIG superfamily endonuclease [Friedmanniella endophytica]|uniref:Putative GIY-YIG superfamily endonuclease n=1 Tax=Microlunatus kandeliicorticis TaxID=1759536 RepID=A0A7W3IVL1_9ACTN|nr:GIY-YIG nuclease family protein [Microlunatus kandeliicorticis]MBA8796071.1 putative GIY-YIG superfamily endonuclease [Microlunatus kandeliicorticis]
MPYTYLLECSDGSYYVGSTRNLDQRLAQHAAGVVDGHTAAHRPVTLVWWQEFDRVDEAHAMERRIHGWRRAKKQALIEGRLADLPRLSQTSATSQRFDKLSARNPAG